MIQVPVIPPVELENILLDTMFHDKRHKHFNRTVELAELYKKLMTGDDQTDLLVTYKPRETQLQQTQRLRLTNSATKHICGKLFNVFKEVDRVDNVVDNIFYQDTQVQGADKVAEIHKRLQVFYKNDSLKAYLDESFKHLNFYDPNAWIVVELHSYDPLREKPYTYPVEVYSDQAINYKIERGLLHWLIVRHPKKIKNKDDQGHIGIVSQTQPDPMPDQFKFEDGFRFTIYGPDYAIVYDQLGNADEVPIGFELVELKDKTGKKRTFAKRQFETKSKINPAICVGYIPDPQTNRETYVGILDSAEKILKDIIRAKSEYDVANALHGYEQKFMYGQRCSEKGCRDGDLADGNKCTACKGTGLKYHTSVQDIILITVPETKEEHIPLKDFVHYVEIPTELIDRHKLDVQQYEKDVSKAIFNVNVFDRSEIAVTATEKKLDLRNIYNVFSPYGDKWSAVFKHVVTLTAIHLQADEKLIIEHKFPSDFKLDSVDELILQRKDAKDAGAPYDVIRYIDMQILAKQNIDNSETVEMIDSIEYWKPFRSKSDQERTYALSQLPPDDESKILWLYWDKIFRMIEIDEMKEPNNPPFHKIPLDKQYELILKKIEIIKKELSDVKEQQIATIQGGFKAALAGQNGGNQNDPAQSKDKKGNEPAATQDPNNPKSEGATLLNGAQIASALSIIEQLAAGQIPRDSAKQMLIEFLGIDPNTAEDILSNIGQGFKPKDPNQNPAKK